MRSLVGPLGHSIENNLSEEVSLREIISASPVEDESTRANNLATDSPMDVNGTGAEDFGATNW